MNLTALRRSKHFEAIYKVGIIIKGIDGLAELVAGLALIISPTIVHRLLLAVSCQAQQHQAQVFHLLAEYVARLDKDLAKSGLLFLTIFLMGHGLVKLILVFCLLRHVYKVYPYALAVLVAFFVYQVYVLVQDPLSIGLWLFTILDIAIIYLVWGEYQDIREKHGIIHTDAKDTSVL